MSEKSANDANVANGDADVSSNYADASGNDADVANIVESIHTETGIVPKASRKFRVMKMNHDLPNFETVDLEELMVLLNIEFARNNLPPSLQNLIDANTMYDLAILVRAFEINESILKNTGSINLRIIFRTILMTDAIIPIVSDNKDDVNYIKIKSPRRLEAISESGKVISFAKGETLHITGLKTDMRRFGNDILYQISGGMRSDIDSVIRTGKFEMTELAIMIIQKYETLSLMKEKKILFTTEEMIEYTVKRILNQYIFIMDYVFGYAFNNILLYLENPQKQETRLAKTKNIQIPTIEISKGLRYLIDRLHEVFPVTNDSNQTYYRLTILSTLFQTRSLPIYHDILINGRESDMAKDFFDHKKMRNEELSALARVDEFQFKEKIKIKQYLKIIEDLFGKKVVDDIIKSSPTRDFVGSPDNILNRLKNARARELVKTEYENRMNYWKQQLDNKCPHLKLSSKLRHEVSMSDTMKVLKDLTSYFDKIPENKSSTSWIKCRFCKFNIICPHVREMLIAESNNKSYENIKNQLMKYAITTINGFTESDSYAYYCKICGEILATQTREERTSEIYGSIGHTESELKKLIWAETMLASKFIRFKSLVDPKKFASDLSNVLHPILVKYDTKSIKQGRKVKIVKDQTEEVDIYAKLYSIIAIYAYILHLIAQKKIGFEGVKPNLKISQYAEFIMKFIMDTYVHILSHIDGVTPEYIASKFRDFFKIITATSPSIMINKSSDYESIVREMVMLDPTYHYARIVAKVVGSLPKHEPKTPEEAQDEFKLVVGYSMPDLVKKIISARKSKYLQNMRTFSEGSLNITIPIGQQLEFIYKKPELNAYSKLYKIRQGDMIKNLSKDMTKFDSQVLEHDSNIISHIIGVRIGGKSQTQSQKKSKSQQKSQPQYQTQSHKKSKPQPQSQKKLQKLSIQNIRRISPDLEPLLSAQYIQSYRLFSMYITNIYSEDAKIEYNLALKEYRNRERASYLIQELHKLKAYSSSIGKKDHSFVIKNLKSTYLYDENGQPHKFNIFIYRQNGANVELNFQDLIKNLKNGISATTRGEDSKWVDDKCSICGVLRSETHKLDSKKVLVSLSALNEFKMFYSFYATRCPEGDLHDFQNGQCVKCNLRSIITLSYQSYPQEARTYFDKYGLTFKNEIDQLKYSPLSEYAGSTNIENTLEFESFAKEYKYNFSFITKASKFLKVTINILESIGASESRSYNDIETGTGAPPPPENLSDNRILSADARVRDFIIHYTKIRYNARSPKLSQNNEELFKKAGLPNDKYGDLENILPDVTDNYTKKIQEFRKHRSPEVLLQFIIESICRMFVSIYETESIHNIAQLTAMNTMKYVLRSEKMMSKPGKFNFGIFQEDQKLDWEKNDGEFGDIGDEVGDIGEDVLKDIEDRSQEEEGDQAHDPFSLRNVDIESDQIENI